MVIFKTQSRREKKTLTTYKTKVKILLIVELAELGPVQPASGATLLGWPKSIYYTN